MNDTNHNKKSPVFMPDNEPYLGRESVFHYDQTIISCMEANADIAMISTQSGGLGYSTGKIMSR